MDAAIWMFCSLLPFAMHGWAKNVRNLHLFKSNEIHKDKSLHTWRYVNQACTMRGKQSNWSAIEDDKRRSLISGAPRIVPYEGVKWSHLFVAIQSSYKKEMWQAEYVPRAGSGRSIILLSGYIRMLLLFTHSLRVAQESCKLKRFIASIVGLPLLFQLICIETFLTRHAVITVIIFLIEPLKL